ncbi:hypothetical protein E5P55_00410 [Candidatus Pinguicoccus supinus]|uniref:Uncharacterized protein n=1 Tax=Candidatus Pinguicoccus supinus TaxID=2529394 RepID=A0A7T0BRQ3_9BACT|nr:hypothetical protein E5P55_00410 [Candidatus Pinguicoccus supinus]
MLKDNKHFKCFSTGLFGDIFKFIQYLYKKSYIWSVIYIVNEFNLKLEATQLNVSSSLQNENHELNNQDVKYIKIFYKIIMNFYHQNLMFKKLSTSFYK